MTSRLPRPLVSCLVASILSPAIAAAEDESPPLSIYGFARLDVLINDSKMSSLEDPAYVLGEPANGQIDSELTMTPRLSRIGLSIDRWEVKDNRVFGEGKVEIDFAGGSGIEAIRLRHAYASITTPRKKVELLAGQTWDLMSPLFPSAQNDSQLRYAGNIGDRRSQLRLSLHPTDRVHLAVAAAAPAVLDPQDLDNDGQVDSRASLQPMLQWLLEVRSRLGGYDSIARIGISGHAARTELGDGTSHASASIATHFFIPFSKAVVILGEGYLGSNLAELGGGIGQGVNPITTKPIRSLGGWIELAVLPTPRHMLSTGTSIDTARTEDLEVGGRERNATIYNVLRYKPRPSLQLGLEHLYWKTQYKAMPVGVANRVNVHFSVFF